MSIESLKQKARKAEQKEDWQKALDHYTKALAELAKEEQVDIGLYNRVGDLHVRVGRLQSAVDNYEKAVELYREAYLPNNAIAVCKKIIRNVPTHHRAYLVIGQIRAEQGFLPDARTNFLTYAERMQAEGDLDESFRALIEFCDLAPEDVGVRITVADQMVAQGRTGEAVEQLLVVHRHYAQLDEDDKADEIEKKIVELDPEADVTAMPAAAFGETTMGGDEFAGFGEIQLGGDAFGSGGDEEAAAAFSGAMEEASSDAGDDDDVEVGLEGFDIQSGSEEEGESAEPLPTMDFDDDDEGEAVELPMMSFDDDEEDESKEAAEPLPTMGFDDDAEEEAPELPTMEFDDDDAGAIPTTGFRDSFAAESEPSRAMEEAAEEAGADPQEDQSAFEMEASPPSSSEVPEEAPPASEEVRPDADDASASPAEPPEGEASPEEAASSEQVAPSEEAAPGEQAAPDGKAPAPSGGEDGGYVDLGAMILGGGDKKSTRFTVAYEEPSGDEEADFAKMLTQFKEKVSENLDSSDVRAHYDLGTAYKEMGLLDEAITSFQAALRASADHLPTYEMMGQTFIEMGQPEAAVRSLERAVNAAHAVEDELVGIYYYLGRAYEALDNRGSAVDYYDRVFALDINFADVTERLRELR